MSKTFHVLAVCVVTGMFGCATRSTPDPAGTDGHTAAAEATGGSDYVLKFADLGPHDAGPGERIYLMRGEQHGFDALSLIMTETQPQGGPPLHTHDSEEAHVLYAGTVTYQIGDDRFTVSGPYVARVPAGVPHTFINAGSMTLNLTCAFPTQHYTFTFVAPNPLLPPKEP
jgi:quercetin dioxygenase-like cupin family protein